MGSSLETPPPFGRHQITNKGAHKVISKTHILKVGTRPCSGNTAQTYSYPESTASFNADLQNLTQFGPRTSPFYSGILFINLLMDSIFNHIRALVY